MTTILLVNTILVFIESYFDLSHPPGVPQAGPSPETWAWIEFGFSNVYLVQLLLALVVEPFQVFWSKGLNRYAA